MHISYLLS